MKLIPLIIASAVILYACDKKASTSTEASKVITPVSYTHLDVYKRQI